MIMAEPLVGDEVTIKRPGWFLDGKVGKIEKIDRGFYKIALNHSLLSLTRSDFTISRGG